MKKFTFFCLCLMLGAVVLLSACQQTDPPAVTDAPSETSTDEATTTSPVDTEDIPDETIPEETIPEVYETVASAPEDKIHVSKVEVKAVGEQVVPVTSLNENMGKDKTHVRVVPPLGYSCYGFEYEGILYAGDLIPLSIINAETELTLRMDYATRELPIVNISVGGQAIASKTDYVDMTFSLENTEDVMLNIHGGIRLRGNSTADSPKKPYRIKFAQKQSLFGLEKAKSWVLLAEYLDPSCLHNYAAMYLGAASDELAFTPTIYQVNLYLDGEYRGMYSLCEQVQANDGRMDLEIPITEDMTELMDFNFFVCMNEWAPNVPGAKEGETYFYISSVGRYFELKYPKKDQFVNEAQFRKFFKDLKAYYTEMASAFLSGNGEWISANVHVPSLVDHLIIDQIMGEKDHVWKSFYTYHTTTDEDARFNGKLCFGPIWDYDYSLYVPWTNNPNKYYEVSTNVEYSNFFYQGLMKSSLAQEVGARYTAYYANVLSDCIKHLRVYRDSIHESLALNEARWYKNMPDLTEDNFEFMIKFLKSRQKVLKQAW